MESGWNSKRGTDKRVIAISCCLLCKASSRKRARVAVIAS
jgi:hypothetical protein